jgi:hypothetical protein
MTGDLNMSIHAMDEARFGHAIAALAEQALQFRRSALVRAGSDFGANLLYLLREERDILSPAKPSYAKGLREACGYLESVGADGSGGSEKRDNFH